MTGPESRRVYFRVGSLPSGTCKSKITALADPVQGDPLQAFANIHVSSGSELPPGQLGPSAARAGQSTCSPPLGRLIGAIELKKKSGPELLREQSIPRGRGHLLEPIEFNWHILRQCIHTIVVATLGLDAANRFLVDVAILG